MPSARCDEFQRVAPLWVSITVRALTLLALCATFAFAQDSLLWGEMTAGPYAVGYRTFFKLDESRDYGGRRGRPILFRVWYPALGSEDAKLAYGEYFEVPPLPQYPGFSERLRSLVRNSASKDLFQRESESLLRPAERAAFQRLLTTRTAAMLDARESLGTFPVVIYHPGAGGSFEENSLLFEYLATFGYIVVSSAYQSPFADSVSNNVGGIERSGPDMAFLVNQARGWRNADASRMAAIGHSAGAQHILQWIGDPRCPLSVAVSLDSTLEYDEFLHLHRHLTAMWKELTPPRIPVMLFARSTPRPKFSAFRDYLRFAPRYEVEVPGLRHDDFLTHGFLGPALLGSGRSKSVREAYQEVCRVVKTFLDTALNPQSAADGFGVRLVHTSRLVVRHKPPLVRSAP